MSPLCNSLGWSLIIRIIYTIWHLASRIALCTSANVFQGHCLFLFCFSTVKFVLCDFHMWIDWGHCTNSFYLSGNALEICNLSAAALNAFHGHNRFFFMHFCCCRGFACSTCFWQETALMFNIYSFLNSFVMLFVTRFMHLILRVSCCSLIPLCVWSAINALLLTQKSVSFFLTHKWAYERQLGWQGVILQLQTLTYFAKMSSKRSISHLHLSHFRGPVEANITMKLKHMLKCLLTLA